MTQSDFYLVFYCLFATGFDGVAYRQNLPLLTWLRLLPAVVVMDVSKEWHHVMDPKVHLLTVDPEIDESSSVGFAQ